MLEQESILIRQSDPHGSRAVVDSAGGYLLGSIRFRDPRPRWLPTPRVREVREAGDAPLIFTVQRTWSLTRRHAVHDAEGRFLGHVAGSIVTRAGGRFFAVAEPTGIVRDLVGNELARMTPVADGIEVKFAEPVLSDPFARMLLLAAALVRTDPG